MSRFPPERQKGLLKAMCAFSLMVFTSVLKLHIYICQPQYDSEKIAMITEMGSLQPLPLTQNHTVYKRSDAIVPPIQKGDDFTRENVMRVMEKMYNGKLINRKYFVFLLRNAKTMLQSLETIYDVPLEKSSHEETKVTIVGDTHGQYHVLLHIFQVNGWPSPQHIYIFNGDYTDKGRYSIENLTALIIFKLYCPQCIHFTRGNHETESFLKRRVRGELIEHYDEEVYNIFIEVIHQIPLAIVLAGKIIVLHSGVSRGDLTIENIRGIKRGIEPEEGSLFEELLWCEPMNENGIYVDPNRGTYFGPDVTQSFLERNELEIMIRGHTSEKDGYKVQHNGKVITIWSSPNKPGILEKGSFLNIDDSLNWSIGRFDLFPQISEIEDWSAL